eukprot:g466.t1
MVGLIASCYPIAQFLGSTPVGFVMKHLENSLAACLALAWMVTTALLSFAAQTVYVLIGVVAQHLATRSIFLVQASLSFCALLLIALHSLYLRRKSADVELQDSGAAAPQDVSLRAIVRDHWRGLLGAGLYCAMLNGFRNTWMVSLPLRGHHIGLSKMGIGASVAWYRGCDAAVTTAVAGYIMDNYGLKASAVPSMLLMSAAFSLLAIVQGPISLALVALVFGVGNGMCGGREKIFSVSAIGTELNCADIGTKNLTRSRLFGLLFMLKMVNGIGDRIGQQEFKDLEYKERMRKATRKIMKVKDLHVGLLMVLSRLDEAAGKDPEKEEEGYDWSWMVFTLCAVIGALSIGAWLRRYVFESFLGKGWHYIMEFVAAKSGKGSQQKRLGRNCVATQAHQEGLRSYLQAYEENEAKMAKKLHDQELYIEELESGIREICLQRQQALKELEISEAYGLRMLKQTTEYRVFLDVMQVPHLLQDIGTSYKPGYGGGWRSEDSFVEFAKAKIDELQAFWSCSGSVVSDRRGRCQQGALEVPISSFTRSSSAIHIHDGLIVFEKHYKEPAISLETGLKRLPKRFEGYSAYRPHLADWTPPEGSCKVPQPFELDIIHESFRSRANQTFSEHVESFMNHVSAMGAAELRQKCGEIMSVLQDGLHWSAFGMDFTLLQLKRRSVSVEWNASTETPLARFLRSTERDVREVLDWYFDKRGTFHPLVLVDLIYRNRWRPTPQALRFARARDALQLQREGFVRFEDFGLDLAWLQTEASAAFAASASTSLVQAKQVRLQSLEPLLKDYGILELTAFYLGADVEVTGYKLLRVREGTTRADYISSFWHHDNCGSRLKLFVFLQDVGEDGYYTEIARGSQSLAYYWYGPAHMSRFDDASVEASFSIEKILSRRGGGFLFDTNTIHRAKVEGPGQLRDAVIVELANAHKMHAGIPAQGPCPEPKTYKVSHVLRRVGVCPWDGQMVHSSAVLRVRIEPGIPKLLVKINPIDAEAFHAKNLGEVTLRKGVTSRSQVAVLHMSRQTVKGEVLMSVKLADLLDLEDGEGVEVAAAVSSFTSSRRSSVASEGPRGEQPTHRLPQPSPVWSNDSKPKPSLDPNEWFRTGGGRHDELW